MVLVDDSIVRGTTSARIIKLLRDAGATEVHFMVSAPPFKYPCYFGTDIPDQKLLVATGRTVEQINEDHRGRYPGLPVHRACCRSLPKTQTAGSAPPASPANMP